MKRALATALPLEPKAGEAIADYFELCKPRVVAMVLLTTLVGFYLGGGGRLELLRALELLAGTALAAGGTLALNEYIERETDRLMRRTANRPLPARRLRPSHALYFGVLAAVGGLVFLGSTAGIWCAVLTGSITVLYLFAYTPLKRVSWVSHWVGAVPGALPPVAGWAAGGDWFRAEPWMLFALMFFWQLPHSLAVASLYQDDYAAAGLHLMPAPGPGRPYINALILIESFCLVAAGVVPVWFGIGGLPLGAAGLLGGSAMFYYALELALQGRSASAGRSLLLCSLVYLPVWFLLFVLDRA
jgi:protoheme IX farnesyltransferase